MARTKKIELNPEQITKLTEWNKQTTALKQVKEDELACRVAIVFDPELFDADKLEGSQTFEIAQFPGWKLSADKVQNYTVTNDNGEIMQALNLIGSATGLNRPDLAQSLVKWKPELSVKAYKDLMPVIELAEKDAILAPIAANLKAELSKAITIKKGTPQLELIAPKAE